MKWMDVFGECVALARRWTVETAATRGVEVDLNDDPGASTYTGE